jgi:hypothetical protein
MYSFFSNYSSIFPDLAPKHGRQRMQEAQDSILAVCKGEETTVTATIVFLVKKDRN